jgi:hypothetical protein
VIALNGLGRTEEATLLAEAEARTGNDVGTLIALLVNTGQQQEAVRFLEERWPDLGAYERDYPILGSGGVGTMLDIALAYAATDNEARFEDAMHRAETALIQLRELGFDNEFLELMESVHAVLSGDHGSALMRLAAAVDAGFVMGSRFAASWAAFKVLEGDPEYQAIEARMFEHLNAERAELGLEPISV